MKSICCIIIFLALYFKPAFSQSFFFDHNSLQEFELLSDAEINAAKNLRIMFRHASVGTTINNALDCLQGTRSNPKECTEYEPYKFDRRNISFQGRPNSGWQGKIDDFKTKVEANYNKYDIFSFKYCFLDGLDETQEPCGKPFSENKTNQAWELLKATYEELENKYPDKIFIWWTIPLTQTGQYCTEYLNRKIRDYCRLNDQILFDIADIECHDTVGNHIVNQQDWEIAFKPYCGEQKEGAQACHPNWYASIKMAKIFWVMMVDIANNYTTGIKDNVKRIVKIYPNPVNSNVNINYDGIKSVKIFNMIGQKIIDKSFINNNIHFVDISDLNSGIYLLKIETDDNVYFERVIKE